MFPGICAAVQTSLAKQTGQRRDARYPIRRAVMRIEITAPRLKLVNDGEREVFAYSVTCSGSTRKPYLFARNAISRSHVLPASFVSPIARRAAAELNAFRRIAGSGRMSTSSHRISA